MEFCHALFRFTNRDLQLVNPCNRRIRFRRQILNVHQIILRQIIERLRHLFEVKDLRPTLIPCAFSSLQLCLNIDQQIDLPHQLNCFLFSWMMLFLACDYRSKCRFRIVLSQRIQSFKPLLSFSFQTDSFSPFNLPSASLEHGQQFFKIFRLACQCSINRFPQSIPLRGFRFITQPFIIALAMSLRLLDNRQTVLDAQCITEPPDGF